MPQPLYTFQTSENEQHNNYRNPLEQTRLVLLESIWEKLVQNSNSQPNIDGESCDRTRHPLVPEWIYLIRVCQKVTARRDSDLQGDCLK